jgi:hypothetical protein
LTSVDRVRLKQLVDRLLVNLDQLATPMLLTAVVPVQYRMLLKALPPLSLSKNSSAITRAVDELDEEELWSLLHRLKSELNGILDGATPVPVERWSEVEQRATAHLRELLVGE